MRRFRHWLIANSSSSTSVISGRRFGVAAFRPLGSERTSLRVSSSEFVADDVARFVAGVLIVPRVLAAAETRYKRRTTERTHRC